MGEAKYIYFTCLKFKVKKKSKKMGRLPNKTSKTYTTPRRPFEKERLDQELKLIGEFVFATNAKSGASNSPSPRSESPLGSGSPSRKNTPGDSSKVTLFCVVWCVSESWTSPK